MTKYKNENYKLLVYKIAFSILKNKEASEDVTQTVFTKIYSLKKEIDNEENLENNFNSEEIIENVENKFEENNNVDEDILNSYNKVLSDVYLTAA